MTNFLRSRRMTSGEMKHANRRFMPQALTAVACLSLMVSSGQAKDGPRKRPHFNVVESFLAIREFGTVRPSPDGSMLAVEVMRPRALPSRPGDHLEARADLWLLDIKSGQIRQLTSGAADKSAAWSPIWSPDSRRLAFLTTARDGLPRAAWIDVRSASRGLLSERGIDVEVNFGSRSPYFGDARIWGAWVNNSEFVAATLPQGQVNPIFRASAPDLVFPPLWERTRDGKAAVTVWDSKTNPSCNPDTSIMAMAVGSRVLERKLTIGSVRAVTISPDRRTAAAIVATGALSPPTLGQFDREFTFQNLDPRVRTQLSLIGLTGTPTERKASAASGFRFQSADDAPRWSPNSRALYAPRFEVTDNSAGNFCVEDIGISNGKARSWPIPCSKIRSRRHAQLLALSLSTSEPASAQDLDQRIARTAASANLSSDPLGADVSTFSLGHGRIGMANARIVRLIDLTDGNTLDNIDLEGGSILLSGAPLSETPLAVVQTGKVVGLLRANGPRLSLDNAALPDVDSTVVSIVPQTQALISIERTAAGEAIWISNEGGGRDRRKLMSLDRPEVADLKSLRRSMFHYRLPTGASAVGALLLPPDYDPSKRYPLIIDVYPFRTYTDATSVRAFDPRSFDNVDVYALASLGYVIARPSLPDYDGDASAYEPLSYYADLIEGFSGEAIAAGLTSTGRVGLWGHSNGGYLGLAVAARTRNIKAIVSYSPFPDLMTSDERPGIIFSPDNCAPNRFYSHQIAYAEDPKGPFWRMGAPSYAAFERYVRNSPIYQLGPQTPATLVVQGEYDSKGTADSERVFTRLARQGVPVQLARYWGEGHQLSSAGNIRDRIDREVAWFDQHLSVASGALTQ